MLFLGGSNSAYYSGNFSYVKLKYNQEWKIAMDR